MVTVELETSVAMRREAFEKEIRLQHQLAQLPKEPSRWRQWTGGGMMWAGTRLVRWGEGMKTTDCPHNVEAVV
jgi:hypothetical protein